MESRGMAEGVCSSLCRPLPQMAQDSIAGNQPSLSGQKTIGRADVPSDGQTKSRNNLLRLKVAPKQAQLYNEALDLL